MRRDILHIIFILWAVGLLWSCTHSPETNQSLIFEDPEAEKRASYLKEKLSTSPDDVEKRIELGRIFLSEDMIEEAITELEEAISDDPERIEAYLLLSLAFQKLLQPNLTKAVVLLEKACQIEPDNGDIHLNLAQVYGELKDEDKAINEFKKTVELSNDPAILVSAHLGLMAIYIKRGESEKANEEYEAACKIYPGVKEMIRQVEINRLTHIEYVGEEFREDGMHPPLVERIKRAQREIKRFSRGGNEHY